MKSIYHGGQKINNDIKTPFFLYEKISYSIYFSLNYSSVNEDHHISEYELTKNSKILDLTSDKEENQQLIDKLMKKSGLSFETEFNLVKNSNNDVGVEIYGHHIDLALYPKFRDELIKAGFNVLKTNTAFENSEAIGYVVLDSQSLNLKREYTLTHDDENVYLKVITDNTKNDSNLGKSYSGKTGYGEISLKEQSKNKIKM